MKKFVKTPVKPRPPFNADACFNELKRINLKLAEATAFVGEQARLARFNRRWLRRAYGTGLTGG